MEADKITVDDNVAITTTFRQNYTSPPLVFILADSDGGDSASIRISSVTSIGFTAYMVEPEGNDGAHLRQEKISYIAIESGTHTLPDGTKIAAGSVSTQRFQSKALGGTSWQSVSLNGLTSTPVVLGMIQTTNNEAHGIPPAQSNPKTSQPWMTTAISNVTSSGLSIALERSETTAGSITANETIAYLAIDSNKNGVNTYFGDNDANRISYETIRRVSAVDGWSPNPRGDNIAFVNTYTSSPIVVATKNSRRDADGGWLRSGAGSGAGSPLGQINLRVDEDKATDAERTHVTKEDVGVLVFSEPFDAEFLPTSSARMLINEVMYNESQTGINNDEFVELFVTQGGDIEGYILSDQDTNYYRFPSCSVSSGDYVVFHTGSGTNSCAGAVKHLYQGVNQYWNNSKDDVLLLRTTIDDVTTTTQASGPKTFNAKPQDYVAYGSSGGSVDAIPTSMKGTTLLWNYSFGTELDNAIDGTSIVLTPNATDSNRAACWEFTASNNAANNACPNYLATHDTNTNAGQNNSLTKNNNSAPNMSIDKTSIVISDGINTNTNAKRISGATIRYCFTVDNTGDASAGNVVVNDALTGTGKDNLSYINAGRVIQNINTACNCATITDTTGTLSGTDVTINIGTLTNESSAPSTARGCVYIEMTID